MIPESHPLQQLFKELVARHYAEQIGIRDPQIVAYVAHLLVDFIEVDQMYKIRNSDGKPLTDVGEMLAEVRPRVRPRAFFRGVGGGAGHRRRRGRPLPQRQPPAWCRPDHRLAPGTPRDTPGSELERHRAQLADLSEEEWDHVDAATWAALAKMLHEPTVLLKETAGTPRGERLVEALRILFDL